MVCCAPSRCILSVIFLSTAVAVLACIGSGVVLILAPEEPWACRYNGGNYTRVPAFVLLAAAVLSLLASFLGCCGVSRDSRLLLMTFSVCTVVIAVMEVAGAGSVFAFTYSGEIEDDLAGQLRSDISTFNENGSSTESRVNKLQNQYDCCGVYNYTDWQANTTWSDGRGNEHDLAPESCCMAKYSHWSNCTQKADTLHSQGCVDVLMDRLKPVVYSVLAVTVTAAILQITGATLACFGARRIKHYQSYDIL